LLAPEQFGVFLVEPDELDQVFDPEVGERLDAVFSDAIDPPGAAASWIIGRSGTLFTPKN